jgi:hypothetical protein
MGRRVGGCYIHRSPFVVRTHVDEDSGSSRVPFKSVGSRNVFSQSAQHHRRHLTTTALMPQRTARCSAPDFRGGTSRRLAACFGSRGSGARIPPPRPFLKKEKSARRAHLAAAGRRRSSERAQPTRPLTVPSYRSHPRSQRTYRKPPNVENLSSPNPQNRSNNPTINTTYKPNYPKKVGSFFLPT